MKDEEKEKGDPDGPSDYIMPIRPVYARKIVNGIKRFEFRKRIPDGLTAGSRIYMYASKPAGKVVGLFTVSELLYGTADALLNAAGSWAGVEPSELFGYFGGQDIYGWAIVISDPIGFKKTITPSDLGFGEGYVPRWFAKVRYPYFPYKNRNRTNMND